MCQSCPGLYEVGKGSDFVHISHLYADKQNQFSSEELMRHVYAVVLEDLNALTQCDVCLYDVTQVADFQAS